MTRKPKEPAIDVSEDLAAKLDQAARVQGDLKALTTALRVDPDDLRRFLESSGLADGDEARELLAAVEDSWRNPAARRRLVVCVDMFWAKLSPEFPTNVVKLTQAVRSVASDGAVQIVYYTSADAANPWQRIAGGAFGTGVAQEIMDSYRFLADNYEPGDEIFLFGFSRGAFVVRAVADLIEACGLLRREHVHQIRTAYQLQRAHASPDHPAAAAFRQQFSHADVRIKCAGLWEAPEKLDLVWPLRYFEKFSERNLSGAIQNAFHALAIDERRVLFHPSLWRGPLHPEQRLEQVWFAGSMSDVGGGYHETGLSDIALLWMIERARECGLEFDANASAQYRPDPAAPIHDPSRHFFYRLTPLGRRKIGRREDTHEFIHASVFERRERCPGYDPPNLRGVALPVATSGAPPPARTPSPR